MTLFSVQQRRKIADYLTTKGVNSGCPRCGSTQLSILPGWVRLDLVGDADPVQSTNHHLLALGASCNRCGYVMLHGLQEGETLDLGTE